MVYHLIAVSGMYKGRLWPIDDAGLLLGRDATCDICLSEPVVSRYQCRIVMLDGAPSLEDAGGRNPVLVNGAAVKAARLKTGDTLGLGRSLFLVGNVRVDDLPQNDVTGLDATTTWDKDTPLHLDIQEAKRQVDLRPNSLSDLVFLYDLGQELSQQLSQDDFFFALKRQVEERFHPQEYGVALSYGEESLDFHDTNTIMEDSHPVMTSMAQECLKQGVGILRPGGIEKDGKKQRLFTMAAPLIAGDARMGVVTLQTRTPTGVFDEDDLKLLVLIAASAGPMLYSIQYSDHLARENSRLRAISGVSETLMGPSRKMGQVRTQIRHAARSNLNVLITGETGTGKELAARMLHAQSLQRSKPLVVVNCAAIPKDLFESELFGYRKGAFTGATEDMPGLLPQAHGGILFLDEIGDLSLENQARILRVVEQGTFRPVGGKEEIRLCIRIVAATNHDLEAAIGGGRFRADLYHRLSGYQIKLPSLREHPDDIPALVVHFLESARNTSKHPISGIAPEAIRLLSDQPWPGNVRELRNCVLRAVATSKGEVLQVRDFANLPDWARASGEEETVLSLAEVEKRHIKATIERCRGNLKAASEALQIARSTLYKKISEYDIE